MTTRLPHLPSPLVTKALHFCRKRLLLLPEKPEKSRTGAVGNDELGVAVEERLRNSWQKRSMFFF